MAARPSSNGPQQWLVLARLLGPWRWAARLVLKSRTADKTEEEIATMSLNKDITNANEALVGMPLPAMLKGLGLAVAEANTALAAAPGPNGTVMTIDSATVELNVAISVEASEKIGAEVKLGLKAFSVNASYARSFGFKEEASSRIVMTLKVRPAGEVAA